jgi:hypothetical protein
MLGQAHLAKNNALATTLWKAAFCFSGSFAKSSFTVNRFEGTAVGSLLDFLDLEAV